MISQIKVIKDIGVFKEYRPNLTGLCKDFGRYNLIFGYNTFGKSTLADVFKDMAAGTDDRIKNRITVPGGNSPQVVIQRSNGLGVIKYQEASWTNNAMDEQVLVFDSEFIYRNVFDGSDLIEGRETKENFTDFILGDTGVLIAKRLEELKRTQRAQKVDLQKYIPKPQIGLSDAKMRKYCELKIEEPIEYLLRLKKEKQNELDIRKKQQINQKSIQQFSLFKYNKSSKVCSLRTAIAKIQDVLKRSFEIEASSVEYFENHIKKVFDNEDKALTWIDDGISMLGDKNICPFCGQSIQGSKAIHAWKEYFSKEYQQFLKNLRTDLDSIIMDWNIFDLDSMLFEIQRFQHSALEVFGEEMLKENNALKEVSERITNLRKRYEPVISTYKNKVDFSIKNKIRLGYISISLDSAPILDYESEYDEIYLEMCSIAERLNELVKSTQSEIVTGDFKKQIESLEFAIEDLDNKINRIQNERMCAEWLKIYNELQNRAKEINILSEQLETDQETYLNEYFETINKLFKSFGGQRFEIEKGDISNKGFKKVIGVNIKFNGTPINSSMSVGSLFSESDKRALALAIFIARIKKMKESEKQKLIVILDDPVTSFDENRIRTVISSISEMADDISQVFVFTHHSQFANTLYINNKEAIQCYIIKRINAKSNGIYEMNAEEEFSTGFAKAFMNIQKFIAAESDNLTSNDLRIFLEEYLNIVFAKQLKKVNSEHTPFGERIDILVRNGNISNIVGKKLHSFRKELNSGSHTFQEYSIEDDRLFTESIIEYVFGHVKMS